MRWRDVPGFEGRYEVSDAGAVCSKPRQVQRTTRWGTLATYTVAGRVLQPQRCSNGYLRVQLGRGSPALVHRLIAAAFLEGEPGQMVNHKDGNRTNNAATNLEWTDNSGNQLHSYRVLGNRKPHAWARAVKVNGVQYDSAAAAGRALGVSNGSICSAAAHGHRSRGMEVAYV